MNIDEIQRIVDNAIELSGCNSEAELARKMKMLPQNFNQKKKRGTIVKAINRFLGKIGQSATPLPGDEYTALIGQAGMVLQSGTIYGDALRQNIKAFYAAVNNKKEGAPLEELG